MGWARFDDNYTDHPKVRDVSALAELLDMRAVIHCARHDTDGLITPSRLKMIAHQIPTVHRKVDELVACGRWSTNPNGGWLVHDYLEYNPSKAQKTEQRERGREYTRKSRGKTLRASISQGDGTGSSSTEKRGEDRDPKSKPPWIEAGVTWAEWNRAELRAREAGA